MTAQSSGSSTPLSPPETAKRTRMNLPDAPAESDSQSQRRRPPPAELLHSECFTQPPPCQTLHQAHKKQPKVTLPFPFSLLLFSSFVVTVDAVKGLISGQRHKHTLDIGRRGRGGGRGARLGGRPALGDRLAFHPGRLPALPKACFCPAALNSDRSALQTRWFLADPLHSHPALPAVSNACVCVCVCKCHSLCDAVKNKVGCNYLGCLRDPSACLFLFVSVSPVHLSPCPVLIRCVSTSLLLSSSLLFPVRCRHLPDYLPPP